MKNLDKLKVCISVKGRFHAFNLAEQLLKKNALNQLITSYPKFETSKYGIPKKFVSSIPIIEIISRAFDKLPVAVKNLWDPQFFSCEMFDRLAARKIRMGADIFLGWSGVSLKSMARARELGMLTILKRGSSHILYQRDIVEEEYKMYGIVKNAVHPKIVEKELQEYAAADYIEVLSSFSKKTFIENGVPADKLIMTIIGVDAQQFKPIKKQDNIFRIIYCGGVNLRKGVQYLLKAFYELNLPHSELWFIGKIDEEAKPLLKKYLSSANIYFKGPFPQSDLYMHYSQGSVFCIASIEEGFGMVIPQAMACGLPVICTEHTGGPDIVRDGIDGFIIPIRDVEALKEKIIFMYENQNRRKIMGENARQRILESFTWDAYSEKVLSAYRKILMDKNKNA